LKAYSMVDWACGSCCTVNAPHMVACHVCTVERGSSWSLIDERPAHHAANLKPAPKPAAPPASARPATTGKPRAAKREAEQRIYLGALPRDLTTADIAAFLELSLGLPQSSLSKAVFASAMNLQGEDKNSGFAFVYLPGSLVDSALRLDGALLQESAISVRLEKPGSVKK
jgi:uncharacterized protein YbjT (DUF2867 family)